MRGKSRGGSEYRFWRRALIRQANRIALNTIDPDGNVRDSKAFPRVFGGFRACLRQSFNGNGRAPTMRRNVMTNFVKAACDMHLLQVGLCKALNFAMRIEEQAELPMIERIERALVLLAYFIELDGDVHVPMYEKFEAELEELKKKEDTKARARQRLLSYAKSRNTRLRPQGDARVSGVSGILDASYSEAPSISAKSGALKAIR